MGASNLVTAMLGGLPSAIRWILSLSRRLLSVVPGFTLYSVAATLVSQFALLLAFVLPLKVILLLGSEGIPSYFPEQFKLFDRQTLILALSSLAMLLYLVHLFAERLIGVCLAGGARNLLLRSRKMVLFDNQDEVATRGYQRYSRGLASLVFVLIFFPLLVWLSPALGGVFAGYMTVLLLGGLIACASSEALRERWSRDFGGLACDNGWIGFSVVLRLYGGRVPLAVTTKRVSRGGLFAYAAAIVQTCGQSDQELIRTGRAAYATVRTFLSWTNVAREDTPREGRSMGIGRA